MFADDITHRHLYPIIKHLGQQVVFYPYRLRMFEASYYFKRTTKKKKNRIFATLTQTDHTQ